MPIFLYEAMDATGMETGGVIEAESREEATAEIRQRGFFCTKISQKSSADEVVENVKKAVVKGAAFYYMVGSFVFGVLVGLIIGVCL